MSDRVLLYASAFIRSAATSMTAVLLGLYLAARGLDSSGIGWVVGAGLAGAATATALVTLRADWLGRRRTLVALALLSTLGLMGVVLVGDTAPLALWAFIGMVNGMGRDRGASLVLEQAALPATATDAQRTRTFAWYNVMQDAGNATGALAAAWPGLAGDETGSGETGALRFSFVVAASAIAVSGACAAFLSRAVEASEGRVTRRVPAQTRRIIARLALLFGIDGLGSGFLTTAFLSYLFFEQFGAPPEWIAAMFFGARVLNALSHLGAAWLAARIGLVNTMVFTHIPSSLLLVTVAFAPSFPVAAILFLLREGLVEMDVPTRQSYLMAVVDPEDRTLASGVTGLVRLATWAVAPVFAGLVAESSGLMVPLILGAGLKIAYDCALYAAFRKVRPPEERPPRNRTEAARAPH